METGPRTRGNASGARGGGKNSTTVGHLPGAQGAKAALGPFSTGGGCHTSRHKQGRGGARELAFISTASRTKRNELKLRREGLKLDIQGKNLPDAKAGEVTEQVMGRAAEARPWRGLRVNIHPSGVVSDTEGPGVLEWRLSDSSSSPEILWLHLKGQTVPR